jgi:hypothetical protein
MPMIKKRLRATIVAAVAVVITVVSVVVFRNLGPWLVVCDPLPESLDLIFTFGGDPERYELSKTFFRRYPEAFWIISVGRFSVFDTLTLGQVVARNAAFEGLDTTRILVDDTCSSTGAEINVLIALLHRALRLPAAAQPDSTVQTDAAHLSQQQRFDAWFSRHRRDTLDIGLVSHHYHTRRIDMVAHRAMKHEPVRLHVFAEPYADDIRARVRKRRWWRHDSDATFVFSELVKLAYYFTVREKLHAARR